MGCLHPTPSPPVLASIGTVLIDVFDKPTPAPPAEGRAKPLRTLSMPSTPSSTAGSGGAEPSSSSSRKLSRPSTPTTQRAPTPQISLDANEPEDAETTYEVFGGGALYALVGARMWLPAGKLRTVVDRRTTPTKSTEKPELAAEHEAILRRYSDIAVISADGDGVEKGKTVAGECSEENKESMWVFSEGPEKRLARARIRYEGDIRLYQHVAKPPHRTFAYLLSSPLRHSEYLHISPPFSPENLHKLLEEMAQVHDGQKEEEKWYPKILFEPTPPSCHAAQRPWLEKVYSGIEVFSPNHEELLSLYSDHPVLTASITNPETPPEATLKAQIEALLSHILALGIGRAGDGAVVVRCGRLGCVVGTRSRGIRWFPAFYSPEEQDKVRDVTGAGNAFLGGYAAGLHLTKGDAYKAALYGTVSSSFVVEQIGCPFVSINTSGEEQWNGECPIARLEKFTARIATSSSPISTS